MRNVLEEMERRLGRDWLEKAAEAARKTTMEEDEEDGIQGMIEDLELEEVETNPVSDPKSSEIEGFELDQGQSSTGDSVPAITSTGIDPAPLRPRIFEISGGLGPGMWYVPPWAAKNA